MLFVWAETVIIREKEEEKRSNINYLCNLSVLKTPVRAEAQAWQARASAQEAAATSLQAQLQQAVDMRGGGGVWAQDGRAEEEGLLCAVGNIGLEDKGSDGGDVAVSASKYLPGM
ncbi:hypothetical protein HID58_066529 [Brassica napus]|uniref:(rape) hypothetical protein n=1 Tax=Brassica napus TaxID=3708 RepID=A0A816L171_BRANA|nr:hypothetical protein HID58_066529 [Brassica napus]CAF1929255.1 unnamed protein product [Brassica napus]